jgi:Transposase IS4
VYTGRKEADASHGLGKSVVISLTRSLENLGCEVFIDNFFNSPLLQVEMLEKKVYLCGTVRADRKHMPRNLSPDVDMERGDIDVSSANGISCIKWMDNRSVLLLTNFLPSTSVDSTVVYRKQKGTCERLRVPCPVIVSTYNKYIGGVDLMDQKKVSYEIDRKAKVKYYLRIFFDLLDIAVNNGHVICVQLNQEAENSYKTLTTLEYRQIIARSLIGNYTSRKREAPAAPVRSLKHAPPAAKPEHGMSRSSVRRRCAQCAKSQVENRTDSMCDVCNIHLCYTKTRNCFADYHTHM